MSINLDKKIKIKNLCSWDLYFKKLNPMVTLSFLLTELGKSL